MNLYKQALIALKSLFQEKVMPLLCILIFLNNPTDGFAEEPLYGVVNFDQILQRLDNEASEGGVFPGYFGIMTSRLFDEYSQCLVLAYQVGAESSVMPMQDYFVSKVQDALMSDDAEHKRSIADWLIVLRSYHELAEGRSLSDADRLWTYECLNKTMQSAFSDFSFTVLPSEDGVAFVDGFYSYDDRSATIRVLGEIGSGFSDLFVEALAAHPEAQNVALGSSGGNVSEAIIAGSLIRAMGLNTEIASQCDSACPLVFLGGVSRAMWDPLDRPLPRFHMLSLDGVTPIPINDLTYSAIAEYVASMGVDQEAYVAWMMSAPPGEESYFTPDVQDLCEANFATWIQRNCF